MANIGKVRFNHKFIGERVKLTVQYRINFDQCDKNSNVSYRERIRVYGDDTGVGDFGNGGDDSIRGGQMRNGTVRSSGRSSITRTFSKTFHRDNLDEDNSFPNGLDDIRARVTLDPMPTCVPHKSRRESNLVRAHF